MTDDVIDARWKGIWRNRVEKAVLPFSGQSISQYTCRTIERVVSQERELFCSQHENYCALGDVTVTVDNNLNLNVDAFIVSYDEKARLDEEERVRAERKAQYELECAQEDQREARSLRNMERQHRRLSRLLFDRIPPSTKAIWGSLTTAQQYAILKDIDYVRRHKFRSLLSKIVAGY